MYKTLGFCFLYTICLIGTIIGLFEKLYQADRKNRDKYGPEGMRKIVANLEVPDDPNFVYKIIQDDGDYFLKRTFWHNLLLYIVIKPILYMLFLYAFYFIYTFFSHAD